MPSEIIPLQIGHIRQSVEIHLESFKGFFLSRLGRRFLRLFYSSFITDSEGVGFVAVDLEGGDVLGVIIGSVSPHGFFSRLIKKKWWAFCLASTCAIIRHPSTIIRLYRALFYRGEVPNGPPRALLSSIAVSPNCQKEGIGYKLMKAWIDAMRQRGVGGIYMTTDACGNEAVNQFYQKQGCRIESTFETPEGRKMNRYVLDFQVPDSKDAEQHDDI